MTEKPQTTMDVGSHVTVTLKIVGRDKANNYHFYGENGDASIFDFWITEERFERLQRAGLAATVDAKCEDEGCDFYGRATCEEKPGGCVATVKQPVEAGAVDAQWLKDKLGNGKYIDRGHAEGIVEVQLYHHEAERAVKFLDTLSAAPVGEE